MTPPPLLPIRLPLPPLPSPSQRSDRAFVHADALAPEGILGWRLLSGLGEDLGVIVGVQHDAEGNVRKIAFAERDGDEPRFVSLKFIRHVGDGTVRLAGPREGYHITRVRGPTRVMRDPQDEDA